MGQAKKRQRYLQFILSNPVPEEGLFLLLRRHGVSTILVVQRGEREEVNAGLFCIDDCQKGLFQCLGRTYASSSAFQEDFRKGAMHFRPVQAEECRRRVAIGLEIRQRVGVPVPVGFEEWGVLLGQFDGIEIGENLYFCPMCDSALDANTQKTILTSVSDNIGCYIACRECSNLSGRAQTGTTPLIKHSKTVITFEELESFSLEFVDGSSRLHMAMPEQAHRDGIRVCLEEDPNPAFAACVALETWLTRATAPNERITDEHVRQALGEIREARQNHESLPETSQASEPPSMAPTLLNDRASVADCSNH